MRDRREDILVRLAEVAATVEDVTTVERNQTDVSGPRRPAIIIMDGDEEVSDDASARRPPNAPELPVMTPEVRILVEDKSPDIGGRLNLFRRRLVRAVKTDNALSLIFGSSGYVRYIGCGTDLARGRKMSGEMVVNFAVRYPLIMSELVEE